MAIGDPYVDLSALKAYLNISGSADDTLVTAAAASASRRIDRWCGRQFNKESAATARTYVPDSRAMVDVDDFYTTTDLVLKTDTGDSGGFDTTIASTDYTLWPRNQVEGGVTGVPYRRINLVESQTFPTSNQRAESVQLTAKWGWNAVPSEVVSATYILAAQLFGMKNATLGVAGFGDFGVVRVRDIPQVVDMLGPFRVYDGVAA